MFFYFNDNDVGTGKQWTNSVESEHGCGLVSDLMGSRFKQQRGKRFADLFGRCSR